MTNSNDYIGSELELFSHAKIWKRYWAEKLIPFIQGPVLEVGAGLGSNTKLLVTKEMSWHQLEPDLEFYHKLKKINQNKKNCEAFHGFLNDHEIGEYQTIIYIDVLEHIQKDQQELKIAASRLKKNGCLIVLSPAHQFLMSNFDINIGHFRRYNKSMLRDLCPKRMVVKKQFYLDSVGLLASFAAHFIKSGNPTSKQIFFWDRIMVPVSKILDPLLFFSVGKTIITIYEKK